MMKMIKKNWWKILTVVLLLYTVAGGLVLEVPRLAILNETIRALFFHVAMWVGMMILLVASVVYAIKYLANPTDRNDAIVVEYASIGDLFGIVGIVLGLIWAHYPGGSPRGGQP